jgi:hypothetical protein
LVLLHYYDHTKEEDFHNICSLLDTGSLSTKAEAWHALSARYPLESNSAKRCANNSLLLSPLSPEFMFTHANNHPSSDSLTRVLLYDSRYVQARLRLAELPDVDAASSLALTNAVLRLEPQYADAHALLGALTSDLTHFEKALQIDVDVLQLPNDFTTLDPR